MTLLDILKRAGGWNPSLYLKIENAPYMALVIEATGESGPSGLPAISVPDGGGLRARDNDALRGPRAGTRGEASRKFTEVHATA